MKELLIRNGQACRTSGIERCDVQVVDGKIAAVGPDLPGAPDGRVVDANGAFVVPGLIDYHVHMDTVIADCQLADSYHSGSHAAVRSGVTTLVGFVTQEAHRGLSACIDSDRKKIDQKSFCDVAFHLTPTRFRDKDWAEIDGLIRSGFKTFKFYTTYREAGLFQDYASLREILTKLSDTGVRVLVHAEDQATLDAAAERFPDARDAQAWTSLRPPEAEVHAVRRLIALCEESGTPLHIVHVSTAEAAKRIAEARRSLPITCEASPHHLLMNEEVLQSEAGHRLHCTPPMRSEPNRAEMETLAVDGVFDIFATDHCAFSKQDKDRDPTDIRRTPSGIPGTGSLFPLMYELLVTKHGIQLPALIDKLATTPARLAGLYPRKGTLDVGADADVLIFNPQGEPRSVRSTLSDCHEPYAGHTTSLDIRHVFLRGHEVVRNNELCDPDHPTGQSVRAVA